MSAYITTLNINTKSNNLYHEMARYQNYQNLIKQLAHYSQEKKIIPYLTLLKQKQKWLCHYHRSWFGQILIVLFNLYALYHLKQLFMSLITKKRRYLG